MHNKFHLKSKHSSARIQTPSRRTLAYLSACGIIACTIFLGGCSTLFTRTASTAPQLHYLPWQSRQQQLNAITNWNINGSLGITAHNKTDIASFAWQQTATNYLINLHGPMNLASTQISGDKSQVTLTQSSGKKTQAATPEQLMYTQLGWALPLQNLNYWVRALPAPHSHASLKFDSYNHPLSIAQQDWHVIYSDFQSFENIDLPTKIYLNSPQLHAKIVIKNWNIK